jgi:hypothetical protein
MMERIADYRELAAQFRQWAENETVSEARDGLLDMARQYERSATELQASAATAKDAPGVPPMRDGTKVAVTGNPIDAPLQSNGCIIPPISTPGRRKAYERYRARS